MPPKPKTQEEINIERELILSKALILIDEKGYIGLTMRDLAKLCDFSPTKIYYYFANKEDIVMNIMQKGYQLLKELTVTALDEELTLKGRSECVCRELFKFGVKYEEYFNLMFAFGVPHTSDFLNNSALVGKADLFKEISLDYYFNFFFKNIGDFAKSNNLDITDEKILSIFAHVVGVIKLHSAKITRELNINVDKLFDETLSSIIGSISTNL